MVPRLLVAALIVFCPFRAKADFILSDYGEEANDTAAASKAYGLQVFANPGSQASVLVQAGGVVFHAKLASNETDPANTGYTVNVGLIHPISPDGQEFDLTGLSKITFEYKNSALITDALSVSFGSGIYTSAEFGAGTVYENVIRGASNLRAHTDWTPASLDIADFATPAWWTAPADFPTIQGVLKKVSNIQFSPRALYTAKGMQLGSPCSRCTGPDLTDITLEIRNVRLVGVDERVLPSNAIGSSGCEATRPFTLLDDFLDGDANSKIGGSWYVYGDSGSATNVLDVKDKSKGASKAKVEFVPGGASSSGRAMVSANLEKRLGGIWHDFAGWAGVGLNFDGNGALAGMENLSAISFRIQGGGLGKEVESLQFKVVQEGVPDSAVHGFDIPAAILRNGSVKTVCVQLTDLSQASSLPGSVRAPIVPGRIAKLRWEARIADQKSSTIDTATANFWITDVKLFGSDTIHFVSRNGSPTFPKFAVHATRGALVLSGFQGFDRLEIFSIEGRKVASFAPAATVSMPLPRGSYLLTGRWKGVPVSIPFTTVN